MHNITPEKKQTQNFVGALESEKKTGTLPTMNPNKTNMPLLQKAATSISFYCSYQQPWLSFEIRKELQSWDDQNQFRKEKKKTTNKNEVGKTDVAKLSLPMWLFWY